MIAEISFNNLIISSDKLDADGMKARLSSEMTTVYIASNVEAAIGYLDVKIYVW